MPSQRLKGLANGKLGCPEEAIDVWPWLQDRFDRGKRRRRSSTPAVVPGAAPALAKAGVGGYTVCVCINFSVYRATLPAIFSTCWGLRYNAFYSWTISLGKPLSSPL